MKVKYLGETSFLEPTRDRAYDALSVEGGWLRVVDDSGEDYLYPSEDFEVAGPSDGTAAVTE